MFFGEIRVFYNPNIIKKVNHSEKFFINRNHGDKHVRLF